jgi:hypothetical protein
MIARKSGGVDATVAVSACVSRSGASARGEGFTKLAEGTTGVDAVGASVQSHLIPSATRMITLCNLSKVQSGMCMDPFP